MSSSPAPSSESFATCDVDRSSSSSSHDELLPIAPSSPDRLRPTPCGSRQDVGSDLPPPDAQRQTSASSEAGLNPFAQEFVPNFTGSAPDHNEHAVAALSRDLASASEDESQSVSGNTFEGTQKKEAQSSRKSTRRVGGLARALNNGQAGQGRTGSAFKGGPGGTDDVTSQSVAGPTKRGQFTSANHLLNFQYDPIVQPSPSHRALVPRRMQKAQPFNKELFLQANYRFLVSDVGDFLPKSLDPDKMPHWEDVAALNVAAPVPVQCPICLETPPVCPQITSCGHIFCFPCILRYFVLGNSEQSSDLFKKCPLCFAITSSKELRSVFVDAVHNYQVGDTIQLTLLNRSKVSIIPFEKDEGFLGCIPYSKDGRFHPFSKFTLTSDITETTDRSAAELLRWTAKAQKEAGEDLHMIPFAFLAIEHLQQRKSAWNEHRASEFLSCSPPVRQRIIAQAKEALRRSLSHGLKISDAEKTSQGKQSVDVASEIDAAMADLKDRAGWVYQDAFSEDEGSEKPKASQNKLKNNDQSMVFPASWEDKSHEKTNEYERASASNRFIQQSLKAEDEDDNHYTFFQCADGQPLIMHPLNMKCLLQHYQSYENLPSRLELKVLEMEGQTQTEISRKRYRFLSHFPLTTNFWFCEVDLRGLLPSSAFIPFNDELRFRETRRRRREKQEQAERLKQEKISPILLQNSPPTAMSCIEDQKEETQLLVSESTESNLESITCSSGPTEQRKLFSQVTRLGFASAHDAPDLTPAKSGEASILAQEGADSLPWSSGKVSTMSFADIIQSQSSKASSRTSRGDPSSESSSKKGKKFSKVLLSTAGGRRY